jgi:hypothetical protein
MRQEHWTILRLCTFQADTLDSTHFNRLVPWVLDTQLCPALTQVFGGTAVKLNVARGFIWAVLALKE